MVLLLGSVSAFLSIKPYDESTKTYSIDDFLGLGKHISDLELKTSLMFKVARGYQKIAEVEIRNGEKDYDEIINGIELYNIKDDMKEIIRNVDYKYKTTVQVPDYQKVCDKGFSKNGTILNLNCRQEQVGLKDEIIWEDFTRNSLLKDEIITLGIFTDVQKGDKIEWILDVYSGKRLTAWAGWEESWNANLISYWKFDEQDTSGSGVIIDAVGFNNGTNDGANNVTGQIKTGYNFTAADDDKIDLDSTQTLTGEFAIMFWFNTVVSTTTTYIDEAGTNDNKIFMNDVAGSVTFRVDGTDNVFAVPGGIVVNNWNHLLCTRDSSDVIACYFNGTDLGDNTKAGDWVIDQIGDDSNFVGFGATGAMDEPALWDREVTPTEALDIYNAQKDGFENGSFTDVFAPAIVLNSPIDNFNSSSQTINFNGTVSGSPLNVTLFIDGVLNETNSSAIDADYLFTKVIADGDHNWTYESCNAVGCTTATTRIFTIDTTAPSVSIESPTGTFIFGEVGGSLDINFTVIDTNLDSCFFDYNGTNTTLSGCTNTTFTLESGDKELTLHVNDTFGNENSSTTTWDYRLFLNSEIFSSEVIEGTSNIFSANFETNGSNIIVANLSYNGTGNLGSIDNHGGNNFTVSKTIIAPPVETDTNISFFWNITQNPSFALDPQNQTILDFAVDECTINNVTVFNFTILNEETQIKLDEITDNTQGKIDLQINNAAGTILIKQFNQTYNQTNPFSFCINSTLGASEQFTITALVEYSADGFEQEFFNIQNETLNSSTLNQNISLYDLNTTDSQVFKLIVKDGSFLAVKDALVEIQRKYISDGVFRIVEIPKTDALGESVGHLVLNDVIYKFIIKKFGVTLVTFDNVIAVCQNPLITTCTIDFNAFASSIIVPNFEVGADFNFTLGFNSTSRIITSTFVIPSGESSLIALTVTREDALGTAVCSDSLTSTSGTLTCTVPSNFGNATVSAKLTRNGVLQAQGGIKLDQNPSDIYDGVLVIMGLFIMMTLIGAGMSSNPVFTILFFLVGVILLFALNLVASNGFIGSTATILFLIIAIVILIIKGGKRT